VEPEVLKSREQGTKGPREQDDEGLKN